MGDSPVLVTGVLRRNDGQFAADYEIRWFRRETPVFCQWCGPQSGDPPPGTQDLADGTLRAQFSPESYEKPSTVFQSLDVRPVDGQPGLLLFEREGFDVYDIGPLFHLVLPPHYLPMLETVAPQPRYGWAINDRFALGWRGDLTRRFKFIFRGVSPDSFADDADQIRRTIKSLPVVPDPQEAAFPMRVDYEAQPGPESPGDGSKARLPWLSGAFYLFVAVVLIAALAMLAKAVPPYAFLTIVIAVPLLLVMVGALQLRQDKRLSEKSFLELMRLTLDQLPLLGGRFNKNG